MDVDGGEFTAAGPPRRDSTSTTGSGKPIPPGHWTLPISGNCPRCRHHHKSVKIHVKTSGGSGRLVDLDCENCDRLWLGHGSRNSTRVSLLSTETIDPPPMEHEVYTTLAHMVRSATRVASLSHTLTGIPEANSTEPSRGPSMRSTTRDNVPEPPGKLLCRVPGTASNHVAIGPAQKSAVPTPNRVFKPNTSGPFVTQSSQFILRLRRRIDGTFPLLKSTRIGRLMKLHDENEANATSHGTQPASDAMPSAPPIQSITVQDTDMRGIPQPTVEQSANVESNTPSAGVVEAHASLMVVDQEVIDAMSLEQRFAFLRSQITAFRSQYNKRPNAVPASGAQDDQDQFLESLATKLAIRNSMLAGVGGTFGEWDSHRGSSATLNRPSLSLSETRMSEAATAVEGRVFASQNYLRDVLLREHRHSTSARPSSTPSSM
jgi:hypothetical protein